VSYAACARRLPTRGATITIELARRDRVVALAHWGRLTLQRLQDRLQHSSDGVAAIARSVGYESESAFGAVFKRMMGESPRGYGRGRERLGEV